MRFGAEKLTLTQMFHGTLHKFIKGLAREGCRHVDGEFAHVANTFLILRGDRGNE